MGFGSVNPKVKPRYLPRKPQKENTEKKLSRAKEGACRVGEGQQLVVGDPWPTPVGCP